MNRNPSFLRFDTKKTTRVTASEAQQKSGEKNIQKCDYLRKTQTQCHSGVRPKTSVSRPLAKRGRALKKSELIATSSTESTNLSEREKEDNLLALKREMSEWKRHEALRSRVNEVLGKAKNDNTGDLRLKLIYTIFIFFYN